jgi:hypothetical protein
MNDDELITALRDSFAGVRSATPAERIISRGRAVRARRRIPAAAALGAAAAVAAVAVTVTGALPAGHPAASRAKLPDARLAAWSVTRRADGTVNVTFRQATDPAGLQRALRADGVPASVTFAGRQNPACRAYLFPPGQRPSRFPHWPKPVGGPIQMGPGPFWPVLGQPFPPRYALVIHTAELPAGAGVQIWTSGTPGAADNFELQVALVRATRQCTGT